MIKDVRIEQVRSKISKITNDSLKYFEEKWKTSRFSIKKELISKITLKHRVRKTRITKQRRSIIRNRHGVHQRRL